MKITTRKSMRYGGLALCLFLAFQCSAEEEKFRYGKVSKEEFLVKDETGNAPAVVLFDIGTQTYEPSLGGLFRTFTRHVRIRILHREGYERGDVRILYRGVSGAEHLLDIDGKTYWQENGEIQSMKLDNKLIFDEELDDSYKFKKFTMPEVKEGCIIEYKYSIRSSNPYELNEWNFQDRIPVRYSELTNSVPDFFTFHTTMVHGKEILEEKLTDVTMPLQISGGNTAQVLETRYSARNLPALDDEQYVHALDDHFTSVRFYLAAVQFPSGFMSNFRSDWHWFIAQLYESESFGQKLKSGNLGGLAPVPDPALTPDEKVALFYDFVTRTVAWDGRYTIGVHNTLKKTLQEKKGSSSDMNLILLKLLQENDIDAQPVLVRTRDRGKPHVEDVNPAQFNHVVVRIHTIKGIRLVDATEPLRPLALLDENDLNYIGLVASEQSPEWMRIVPQETTQLTFMANCKLSQDGSMDVSFSTSNLGYFALNKRVALKKDKKSLLNELVSRVPDAEIGDYTVTNIDSVLLPLKAQVNYSTSHFAQAIGDSMFITLAMHPSAVVNPFERESRVLPVEFPFPYQETGYINIELPSGFSVAALPEFVRMTLEDGSVAFSLVSGVQGNIIQFKYRFELAKQVFAPEEYSDLRAIFLQRFSKLNEKIVLSRK